MNKVVGNASLPRALQAVLGARQLVQTVGSIEVRYNPTKHDQSLWLSVLPPHFQQMALRKRGERRRAPRWKKRNGWVRPRFGLGVAGPRGQQHEQGRRARRSRGFVGTSPRKINADPRALAHHNKW